MREPTSRRGFLSALATVPALAIPAIVVAKQIAEPASPELLHSYREWLSNELRQLEHEMFGARVKDYRGCIFFTAAHGYHWNSKADPRSASERARLVLDTINCPWSDGKDRPLPGLTT